MGNGKKSDANSEPAAQDRGRSEADGAAGNAGAGDNSSLETTLARAEATLTLLTAWISNIQRLFQLELDRTLTAGKRLIFLQLMLVPLGTALLISLCGGIGLIAYYFSQSVYIGFLTFLLMQIFIFVGVLLYQRKLRPLLGFEETKRQVKEALSDVAENFK
ncbi:hypothetical protein [Microbulbifer sp. GL-2]|uniref:hypothetical protein n=1 Tax=Microbulbifer sp. GL-2 TaxID=2591606 RepID=UPI00116464A8|nr:hypothetical protein [Microbulbifer sp. GL-2]BBM00606.1 hypothetical protein GL2_06800 [Microbulbifer sp. GL-2]